MNVPLEERSLASVDGALAAGGGGGQTNGSGEVGSRLNGRISLSMSGLFRRDRTFNLNYERPRPGEMLLAVSFGEQGAFRRNLDWRVSFDEWNRSDHRQHVSANIGVGVKRSSQIRLEWEGRLMRLTPGGSGRLPVRNRDLSVGLRSGALPRSSSIDWDMTQFWRVRYTYSRSSLRATGGPADAPNLANRQRLEAQVERLISIGERWQWRMAARGRWWIGRYALRGGDEWFLGGGRMLRGYEDRDIAAVSGWLASVDILNRLTPELGIAAFVDFGVVRPFDPVLGSTLSPASFGGAFVLSGRNRRARLEFAWRDGSAWRDGLVRLGVSQGW